MKFSALNVDFDGPSLDFPVLREPAHNKHYSDELFCFDMVLFCSFPICCFVII